MSFSRRVAQLPGYPMAELPAIKRRLIEQGVDVIDVGAGDADFPPPEVAVKALTRAVQDPAMSRYAFQLGLVAFREAAAGYMRRRFGVSVDPFKELHPLLGSKEASRTSRRPCSIPATWRSCRCRATPSIRAALSSPMPSRISTISRRAPISCSSWKSVRGVRL